MKIKAAAGQGIRENESSPSICRFTFPGALGALVSANAALGQLVVPDRRNKQDRRARRGVEREAVERPGPISGDTMTAA